MSKNLLIALGFAVFGQAYRPLKCPPEFLWTDRGCIEDCKAEKFVNCPDFYDSFQDGSIHPHNHILNSEGFQGNFCGVDEENNWISFTSRCQACSAPGIIGVSSGKCQELKRNYLRKEHQHYGRLRAIDCPAKRPNIENCPQLDREIKSQLDYCGVTANGLKKGFNLPCSACLDPTIQYYYISPCSSIGIQAEPQPPSVSIPLAPVALSTQPPSTQLQSQMSSQPSQPVVTSDNHSNNFCFDDTCCQQWQFCIEKKCTDRCAMMRCVGGCARGKCQ